MNNTSLVRSTYYILNAQHSINSAPLNINKNIVFLHKEYRGFKKHSIPYSTLLGLVKILAFKYFNFEIENLNEYLLSRHLYSCNYSFSVNESGDISNFSDTHFLNLYTYGTKYTTSVEKKIDSNFLIASKNQILNSQMYIFPKIKHITELPDFTFIFFCEYINQMLKSPNISRILIDPIKEVFTNINYFYRWYIISLNIEEFKLSICPTLFDYTVVSKLFEQYG